MGADFILWADADHVFPDHALIRLFSLNLPVVGCNYPTRVPPLVPTALGLDGQPVVTPRSWRAQVRSRRSPRSASASA
jgi:hypothetical protein